MSLMEREEFGIEKIIQELQEAVDLGDAPKRGPFGVFVRKEYLVEAIALLRTYPDAQQAKPKDDGWISVEDGRPEYCENVLVYYAGDGINHPRVSESFRMYDEVFLLESVYGPVTHWRPLPEPPEEA